MRGCRKARISTFAATPSEWRATCIRHSPKSSPSKAASHPSVPPNTCRTCNGTSATSATCIEHSGDSSGNADVKHDVRSDADRSEVERIKESSDYLRGTIVESLADRITG